MSSPAARRLMSTSLAVETVCMLPIGCYVLRKARFRPILQFAIPVYCVGEILLIVAAKYHVFGLLLFSMALTSVSRSAFETVKEVALLSGARCRPEAALLLALLSLSKKIGAMIGATLSDIVWAQALPNPPTRYLNGQTILSAERVHPLLAEHLAYSPGSAERNAIVRTYEKTQIPLLAIGAVAMLFAWVCVCKMDDVPLLEAEVELAQREEWAAENLRLQAIADADWGADLNRTLRDPKRREDLAAALEVDVARYRALEVLKEEDLRMTFLSRSNCDPRHIDDCLFAWGAHDHRVRLLGALEDDDRLQELLDKLQDEEVHKSFASALNSYQQRPCLLLIMKLLASGGVEPQMAARLSSPTQQ